jgi:hypothetical protein
MQKAGLKSIKQYIEQRRKNVEKYMTMESETITELMDSDNIELTGVTWNGPSGGTATQNPDLPNQLTNARPSGEMKYSQREKCTAGAGMSYQISYS